MRFDYFLTRSSITIFFQAEDHVESLQNQLERATRTAKDYEEENKHLHAEYEQVGF